MPASKAQQKAVNKYMAANYDRINVTMPKGKKEVIQSHAQARGESTNSFINRAIDRQINGAPSEMAPETPVSPPLAQGVVVLPSKTIKAAERASEATGEALEGFVARSVGEQVKRDGVSWRMGINPATGEKISKGGTGHE